MEDTQRVPCPYCRELILPGALKCKECSSNLAGRSRIQRRMEWVRNFPDRKLLGVASCLAHNFQISPTMVRLIFVLLTFVSLLGIILYLALAAIIPAEPGTRSFFETSVDALGAAFDNFRRTPATAGAPAAPRQDCVTPTSPATTTEVPPYPPSTTATAHLNTPSQLG